jgi:hypothetical protein
MTPLYTVQYREVVPFIRRFVVEVGGDFNMVVKASPASLAMKQALCPELVAT